MSKLLFLISSFILCSTLHAQKFDGYYIANNNDTIKCSFNVRVNLFDSKIFEKASVKNKIKVLNANGEKLIFKPNEIQSFFIRGTKTGDYKFVSIENKNNFYHEVIKGKLSYYKLYRENSGGVLGALVAEGLYLSKDKKLIEINPLNLRKGLAKQIEDYEELHQKWMDSDTYYKLNQFEEVIKLYNTHFQ